MTQIDSLTEILQQRSSCRAFKADPVPDDVITRIVATARHVPSWCNAQPWQLSITKGRATDRFRTALTQAATQGETPKPDVDWPAGYSGVYAERRRACGFQLYDSVGIEKSDHDRRRDQMLRNYAMFDAPHVAIITSPTELGAYGAMDCGGFITAFTLAASALGVATIAQAAIAAYAPQIRQQLDIADDRLILCAISFGYAAEDAPINKFRTARADPADIIAWHS